jgi:hypothetical protein
LEWGNTGSKCYEAVGVVGDCVMRKKRRRRKIMKYHSLTRFYVALTLFVGSETNTHSS